VPANPVPRRDDGRFSFSTNGRKVSSCDFAHHPTFLLLTFERFRFFFCFFLFFFFFSFWPLKKPGFLQPVFLGERARYLGFHSITLPRPGSAAAVSRILVFFSLIMSFVLSWVVKPFFFEYFLFPEAVRPYTSFQLRFPHSELFPVLFLFSSGNASTS